MGICKLTTETMSFVYSKKAKEKNKLQKELEQKLKSLETQLISDSSVLADYNKCKSEWEEILKFKVEGIQS